MTPRRVGLLLVAGLLMGGAAYWAVSTRSQGGDGLSMGALLPCGDGESVPMAMLAAPTASLLSANNTGVQESGLGDGSMLVYSLDKGAPTADAALAALASSGQAGLMYSQTRDATFRSCDYHFEDNPRALSIAQQTTPLMVKAGYLTSADLDDRANLFLLSDDPLNANELIFTVVLHGVGGTEVATPRGIVSAVIDRDSEKVISLGHGNLYANCTLERDCHKS